MMTLARFNKSEAIHAVQRISQGVTLNQYEIDRLLNYLLPVLPASPKTAWDFVLRAMPDSHIKYYLNAVHVIDGTAYATDGHRVHWTHVDMPNGVYDRKKELVNKDHMVLMTEKFFKTVIPDCINRIWVPVTYDIELLGTGKKAMRAAVMTGPENSMKKGMGINLQYLLDAIAGDALYTTGTDSDNKIRIRHKLGEAVVMGLRL